MRYADFNGIELSRLGMGNMRLPVRGITRSIDAAKARAIIDYCMESGVNYYDTALFYHHGASEPFLGKALSRHPRDSYYLADKYLFVRPDYKRVFEGQLKKLKTDRIDFYLVHSLMDVNVGAYEGNGCIDYFLEQQRQGRIGYLGFSSHASTKVLKRFLDKLPSFFRHFYAIVLVIFGWGLFKFTDVNLLGEFFSNLFDFSRGLGDENTINTILSYLPLLISIS